MRRFGWLLWLVAVLPAVGGAADKKLIAVGWDIATPARLRQNLAEMEKRPFDGVVLSFSGGPKNEVSGYVFTDIVWKQEWIEPLVADLQACRFQRFTDNFLKVNANPGSLDWFDDAGWQQTVDHWRKAAWIAKQGGLKGLLFDPEAYVKGFRQFDYTMQAQRDRHTFPEYVAKARQRGQEVMRAVVEEFPDLILFSFFMNSNALPLLDHPDPRTALLSTNYNLYPPFIDGWLDVMPPSVTLIDGIEQAYLFDSPMQYYRTGHLIKSAGQKLIAPENRYKYRAQTQVSYGIYLDAYINAPPSIWRIELGGRSPADKLRENVASALAAADEYVWVYGEQYRWWPTPNTGIKPEDWNQAMPGCEEALRLARDPADWGRWKLGQMAAEPANLARNADFASTESATVDGQATPYQDGGPPAGWGFWQVGDTGAATWDRQVGCAAPGAYKLSNVRNGCGIQAIVAKPGGRYAVRAKVRVTGGDANLRIRWQAGGKWYDQTQDRLTWPAGEGDWKTIFDVVQVPAAADRLVVLLVVTGQLTDQDAAWFDDIAVLPLD